MHNSIHKCGDTNQEFSEDNVILLSDFEDFYTIVEPLGRGVSAKTYKILEKSTNEILVLKKFNVIATNYFKEITEFDIGCLTPAVNHLTNSISTVLYTFVIKLNPKNHKDAEFIGDEILTRHRSVDFIYLKCIIMPYYDGINNLLRASITDFDKFKIYFECFVACLCLDMLKIQHRDFSIDNILLVKVDYIRQYTINGITYYIDCEYLPIIIDFGLSTFNRTRAVSAKQKLITKSNVIDLYNTIGRYTSFVNSDIHVTIDTFSMFTELNVDNTTIHKFAPMDYNFDFKYLEFGHAPNLQSGVMW